MSKFKQIMDAIQNGVSFSWGFGGITPPEPTELQLICEVADEARIGYHTQIFLARALYYEDLKITYEVLDNQVKIYY